jgi:hypothetical protein
MKQWWVGTDRGKSNYAKINLSEGHLIHHRSHMDCPGIEKGSPWQGLTRNSLSHGMAPYGFTDLMNTNRKVKVTL